MIYPRPENPPLEVKEIDGRMKYLGYDTYSELVRSMPDIVSCRMTADDGEWVYPAPPGLVPPPNLLTPIPMPNQVEGNRPGSSINEGV